MKCTKHCFLNIFSSTYHGILVPGASLLLENCWRGGGEDLFPLFPIFKTRKSPLNEVAHLGSYKCTQTIWSKIYTFSALRRQRQAQCTTHPNSSIVPHSLGLTISSPRNETRVGCYSLRSWRVFLAFGGPRQSREKPRANKPQTKPPATQARAGGDSHMKGAGMLVGNCQLSH